MRRLWPSLALLVTAGCLQQETIPDPNEPLAGQQYSGAQVQTMVREIFRVADAQVRSGRLSPSQRDVVVSREVGSIVANVDPEKVRPTEAWRYGDAFRIAGRWQTAERLFKVAVQAAKTNDRLVNDSLKLARVEAHLGKIDEALAHVRSTYKAPPTEKAPILMATAYEIVPEAVGKDRDKDLAGLLLEAIEQHSETIVDPTSDAGRDFLKAKPLHIAHAYTLAARLFQSAGDDESARKAIEAREQRASDSLAF
ncbi:MAG: hypothetical protein KF733_03340 [Fimbriimonadaceae bacterium]|nr:MAG: hypothetical protein KF733_03340 [Fimbriimonadaceae bacterium]